MVLHRTCNAAMAVRFCRGAPLKNKRVNSVMKVVYANSLLSQIFEDCENKMRDLQEDLVSNDTTDDVEHSIDQTLIYLRGMESSLELLHEKACHEPNSNVN